MSFASLRAQIGRRRFCPFLESMEDRIMPSVDFLAVTNLADSNDPNSGSLRAAITIANNSNPSNGIVIQLLKAGTYALTLSGADEDNNASGDLDILRTVYIENTSSADTVTIDASGLTDPDRVFDIGPNGSTLTVYLSGLAIQGGSAITGGGIRVPGASKLILQSDYIENNSAGVGGGGGVFMLDGTLSLERTTIRDNTTAGSGGGLLQGGGELSMDRSQFLSNHSLSSAGQGGGGVRYSGTGDVSIDGCEFASNTAISGGGGFLLNNNAGLKIEASTFDGNRSNADGGGLFIATGIASTLTNVTIVNNVAQGTGGGIYDVGNGGILTLQNDTIAFNTANTAGGAFINNGNMRLINTIIAQNVASSTGAPDVNSANPGSLVDVAGNFIGINLGASNSLLPGTPNANGSFVGISAAPLDPLLGPVDYTSPVGFNIEGTYSNLPNRGNNGVRDRGRDAGATDADERGFPRVSGAHTDIGAFEFQHTDMAVTLSNGGPTDSTQAGSPITLGFVVTNNGPRVTNGPVTSSGVVLSITLPGGTLVDGASVSFTAAGNVVSLNVPDLGTMAHATITLTVTPNAPGPFTANAALGIDPNLTNNSAAVSFDVTPAPFPAKGSADVASMVQVTLQGRRRAAKRQTFSITNTSNTPIQGPIGVLPVLSGGVKLKNASGQLAKKQKFVRVSVGADNIFTPGESVSVQLVFSKAFLPRWFKVMAGAFG